MTTEALSVRGDAELLAEYLERGTADAFTALVQRHTPLVYSACFRVLNDRQAAEDASQATFLVLIKKIRALPQETLLAGWLYTTALRIARNALRTHVRRTRYEESAALMQSSQPAEADKAVSTHELRQHLDLALASLPAPQRNAIVLRYLHGKSEADAAREMNCPLNTLHTRVSLGMSKLREKLGRQRLYVSLDALTAGLATCVMETMPQGLAEGIASACLGKVQASATALSLAEAFQHTALWLKLKVFALIGVLAVMIAGAVEYSHRGAAVTAPGPSAPSPGIERAPLEFHVSPTGAAAGDGSAQRPWDLATALSHSELVRPGDRLWLSAGEYRGTFLSALKGTAQRPIAVKAVAAQRVTLVGGGEDPALVVRGEHTHFHDLEVVNPVERRTAGNVLPDAALGVAVFGPGTRLVNLVVHDCATGIAAWRDAADCELSGCIIYHNGCESTTQRSGNGITLQNTHGDKRIRDCIIFNNITYGISAYGSKRSAVRNLRLEGNILFSAGMMASEPCAEIHIGGDTPLENISVKGNYTWTPHPYNKSMRLSSVWAELNNDITVQENYLAGTLSCERDFRSFTFKKNTVISERAVELYVDSAERLAGYAWDDNRYLLPRAGQGFSMTLAQSRSSGGLEWWQARTALDAKSTLVVGALAGTEVFVRQNPHSSGRTHIVVYNWDKQPEVTVAAELLQGLALGDNFEVRRAQDFFGEPVLVGTFEGRALALPMHHTRTALTLKPAPKMAPVTTPVFDVFVVMKR